MSIVGDSTAAKCEATFGFKNRPWRAVCRRERASAIMVVCDHSTVYYMASPPLSDEPGRSNKPHLYRNEWPIEIDWQWLSLIMFFSVKSSNASARYLSSHGCRLKSATSCWCVWKRQRSHVFVSVSEDRTCPHIETTVVSCQNGSRSSLKADVLHSAGGRFWDMGETTGHEMKLYILSFITLPAAQHEVSLSLRIIWLSKNSYIWLYGNKPFDGN